MSFVAASVNRKLQLNELARSVKTFRLHLLRVEQWFLTLFEVLNPTSSIHAFIKPFVVGKIKCVSWVLFFFTFIAQNLLPPNPWSSIEPKLRTTALQSLRFLAPSLLDFLNAYAVTSYAPAHRWKNIQLPLKIVLSSYVAERRGWYDVWGSDFHLNREGKWNSEIGLLQ